MRGTPIAALSPLRHPWPPDVPVFPPFFAVPGAVRTRARPCGTKDTPLPTGRDFLSMGRPNGTKLWLYRYRYRYRFSEQAQEHVISDRRRRGARPWQWACARDRGHARAIDIEALIGLTVMRKKGRPSKTQLAPGGLAAADIAWNSTLSCPIMSWARWRRFFERLQRPVRTRIRL